MAGMPQRVKVAGVAADTTDTTLKPLTSSRLSWLGLALLVAGLSGHLFAARGIGGYYRAYRDHIFGFFLLTTVSIAIVAGLGWKFWKGRQDITLLIVGVLQAIAGLLIYIFRYHV